MWNEMEKIKINQFVIEIDMLNMYKKNKEMWINCGIIDLYLIILISHNRVPEGNKTIIDRRI